MNKWITVIISIIFLAIFMSLPVFSENAVTYFQVDGTDGFGLVTCEEKMATATTSIPGYTTTVSLTPYFYTGSSYLPYTTVYGTGEDSSAAMITDSQVAFSFAIASFGTTQTGDVAYVTHFRWLTLLRMRIANWIKDFCHWFHM